ncbi:MATE family efflux transporter [Lactiplantibacillus plantarum]|nr:hypothetical protein [Lactiplantibacillus plantarum]
MITGTSEGKALNNTQNNIRHGILAIFFANIVNMVIGILTNFLLPKYLSVNSYAAIKTYQLYATYAGLISLGFVDGMFLKYGGRRFKDLDKNDLDLNISSFRLFQVISTIILIIIGFFFKTSVYWAFVLSVLPLNMIGYFQSLYQSIGEFSIYSRIMNATTATTFILNMVLLFVIKTDNSDLYLIVYVLLDILIWIALERIIRTKTQYNFTYTRFSLKETIKNIEDGILLMLGNFSNSLLTSMDRWFIKFLMSTFSFAQYSFACSMESFVNVAVTPITVTMYNYFCTQRETQQIRRVRNVVALFASVLIACAFPGKFILEFFLKKYIFASGVMFYLFAAQFFYIIIKSVYVNLYKVERKQKRYFFELIVVIVAGFVFNVICWLLFRQIESFAIGNLLAAILWFVISLRDFRYIGFNVRELSFMIVSISTFLLTGMLCTAVVGFIIYIFVIFFTAVILMKSDTVYLIKTVYSTISSRF